MSNLLKILNAQFAEKKSGVVAEPVATNDPLNAVTTVTKPLAQPSAPTIQLSDEQLAGIDLLLKNKYGVLIGSAGTGKTTTAKELIRRAIHDLPPSIGNFDHLNLPNTHEDKSLETGEYPFVLCAYTGMAVRQMRKAVKSNPDNLPDFIQRGPDLTLHCYTIHKTLDYGPVEMELPVTEKDIANGAAPGTYIMKRVMLPRRDRHNLLPLEIVIIDEISMVGSNLWHELLDALPTTTRIYVIGDIAQLPPVFGTSVMPYMLRDWPIAELTKIYRQKEGSLIDNANRIRVGQPPVLNETFKMLQIDKGGNVASHQIIQHIKGLYSSGQYDPAIDQILCTNNTTAIGQEQLNIFLRTIFNPDQRIVKIKTMKGIVRHAIGDRVMCTKNDADLGIYNGLQGRIVAIKPAQGYYAYDQDQKIEHERLTNPDHNSTIEAFNNSDGTNDIFAEILEEVTAKQSAEKEAKKMAAMFGAETANRLAGVQEPMQDEGGTDARRASHIVDVLFEDHEHPIALSTSSELLNLKTAYAITVHKSQGSGFRNVICILHDLGGPLLKNELLYTAVTRCQESVTIMTTRRAFNKALTHYIIPGNSLGEKVHNFILKNTVQAGQDDKVNLPAAELLPVNFN